MWLKFCWNCDAFIHKQTPEYIPLHGSNHFSALRGLGGQSCCIIINYFPNEKDRRSCVNWASIRRESVNSMTIREFYTKWVMLLLKVIFFSKCLFLGLKQNWRHTWLLDIMQSTGGKHVWMGYKEIELWFMSAHISYVSKIIHHTAVLLRNRQQLLPLSLIYEQIQNVLYIRIYEMCDLWFRRYSFVF